MVAMRDVNNSSLNIREIGTSQKIRRIHQIQRSQSSRSFHRTGIFQVALAVGLLFSLPVYTMNSANAKKPKYEEGMDEHFKGIMSAENTVTMKDPLWERYAFAGKRAMERPT